MTEFQRLVLRALGSLLYCVVWNENPVLIRQGVEERKKLLVELREAAIRGNSPTPEGKGGW